MKKDSSFSYNIESIAGKNLNEVKLSGRLMDEMSGKLMVEELNTYLDQGKFNFIMNLKELEYINSSGLNNLVNLLTKSRSKGGDVILSNLSDKVKNLFIVTKLNTVFTVTESDQEALECFQTLN